MMDSSEPQEWRIEIGRTGQSCHIFLNGVEIGLHLSAVDLHVESGRPSTLYLTWAEHIRPGMPLPQHPIFRDGDILVADGIPKQTYIDIDGRRFRLMEVISPEDTSNGLFRAGDDTTGC